MIDNCLLDVSIDKCVPQMTLLELAQQSFFCKDRFSSHFFPKINALQKDTWLDIDLKLTLFHRMPFLSGTVFVDLTQACNRCMTMIEFQQKTVIQLVFSNNDKLSLPKSYENYVLDEAVIKLVDLIDDEVLLSLPVSMSCSRYCIDKKYVNSSFNYKPFNQLKRIMK